MSELEKTFFGYWPADIYYSEVDVRLDEHGFPDNQTQKFLRETSEAYAGDGWEIIIANDYLCLLHLAGRPYIGCRKS